MAAFKVRIEVGDAAGQRFEPLEALVDTGATNTVVPRDLLQTLGVQPYRSSTFWLADGRQLQLDIGRTWVTVDGQREFTQVVFGPVGCEPVLGAVTLEEMGLAVDSVARRLVPVHRYLM
ncbi:MAG: aspartyl protease family protein [Dehalococcoidia bacterium]|nr:aspartyl protease family protein [Dehalococcoidia bacterium]